MNSDQNQTPSRISLFTAVSIVVANMVGTGVFTSLGFQAVDIKSGFALLCLWIVGGVYALSGALSYAELGAVMPRSGGEYHYLSKIYHPAVGFLSGWVSVTVGFAAPIALAAILFGSYSSCVFLDNCTEADGLKKAIALVVAIGISLIHTRNLKVGSSFQDIFTALKVLLIIVFIACGFFLGNPQDISFLPNPTDTQLIFSSPFAISLVYVTYSYSGWNAAIYLASELEQPEKNLPRALLGGTAIVMVLYILLNFIFLYTTPISALEGQPEVGYIAAKYIFGNIGSKIMGLLISLGLLSTISSMVWAGPRVTQVIGEDIPFFKILAKKNSSGIPYYAILLQLAIVLVMVITSTFETVTTYLQFTLILSSFMTVLGLFIHRIKNPDFPRPYKTWGYPVTPLIFLGVSVWIMIFVFQDKPWASLAGLATIALGLPIYFLAAKNQLASSDSEV